MRRELVYPNPVKDWLFVNSENCKKIEVYNDLGKLISTEHKPVKIYFKNYSPGIYIVIVATKEKTYMNKVVKL